MISTRKYLLNSVHVDHKGCWIWRGGLSHGYGKVSHNGKAYPAHKFYFQYFKRRKVPKGKVIMHMCDVPPCCNPDHLKVGTYKENMEDRAGKNRRRIGPMEVNYFLHWKIKWKVMAARGTNESIAAKYGISVATVKFFRERQRWLPSDKTKS